MVGRPSPEQQNKNGRLCETPHAGHAGDMRMQRNHRSAKGRHDMRRMIILAAMAVIAATAAIWSIVIFAKPKAVGDLPATDTSAQISPHEMMIKQGKLLPVEYWTHPF
jgi:hypothetical protein